MCCIYFVSASHNVVRLSYGFDLWEAIFEYLTIIETVQEGICVLWDEVKHFFNPVSDVDVI